MKHLRSRTLAAFLAAFALFFMASVFLPATTAQARGSAGHSSFSAKSGYKTGGYSAAKNSTGKSDLYSGGSRSYSSSHFFFFPTFFGWGGSGFSSLHLVRDIVIVVAVILFLRWLHRRRRR